ncbi:hypothetical protein JXA47_16435 [Candidatus Sumerlaeota bacterium]|nr:hypothetical protein [Candidatus Sumerlaeota bacterium]
MRAVRFNLMMVLVAVLYLVTVGLALVVIDKGIYQGRKQSLIFERFEEMLNITSSELGNLAVMYANATSDSRRDQLRERIQQEADEQLALSNGIWRISVYGPGESLVAEAERPEIFRENYRWSNSLLFWDFSHVVRNGWPNTDAYVLYEYTTPLGVPAIEELTSWFRMLAFAVWGAITIAFILAMMTVVLPIRRVMGEVAAEGTQLLRHPRSALERGYNAVATKALAAQLSQRITALVQTPSLWTAAEFDPPMIEAVVGCFGLEAAALVAMEPTSGDVQVRVVAAAPGAQAAGDSLRRVKLTFEDLDPAAPPKLLRRTGEKMGRLVVLTPVLETASSRLGLITVDIGDWSLLPRWHVNVVRAVAEEVRRGLVQMPVFRDYLFRQKSQANISLARSLGHDLTNVIATSKFDILAIQTWLKKRQRALEGSGDSGSKREAILAESVQGLLNTTKFMQEIVNIYRAFSYMDEPKWERVDFNALVSHLCELFRLTLSRRIDIQVDLDGCLDPVLCEPRLIQLSLFNLLTNANQAIKRLGENEAGTIRVTTRRVDRDHVELTVHDSGPGIRGADGALLEGEALYQVFFLGITTRREGEEKGEGLGLNWVWSIIRDMHAGEVEPANHAEGGAVFHLRLPIGGPPDASAAEETAQEPQETSNV